MATNVKAGASGSGPPTREEPHYDSDTDTKLPMMPQSGPDERSKPKMGEEVNPAPTGAMSWIGFGCSIFALAALCIAFASPYWMQTWPNSFNQFQNIGLWEVCMDHYMHYKDDSQEVYSGCWWVFNRAKKYWKLREWLLPPWFITVQVLAIACLLVSIATIFTAATAFLHFCPLSHHEYYQSYAMFAASALMFLSSMMSIIAAATFGVMCQDWQWMPRPDWNFLSWGFGFFVIHSMAAAAAGVCFFMESKKVYDKLQAMEDELTRMTLQMSAYPPSAYSDYPPAAPPPGYNGFGQQSYPTSYGQPSLSQHSYGQPSYSQPSFEEKKSYSEAPTDYDQYSNPVEQSSLQYALPEATAPQYDQYGNPVEPAPQYDQYGNPVQPAPQYDQYGNLMQPYYYPPSKA